jgi:4-diphosphocytidyl-2-C-methyl-D-erythritol kinase
VVKPAESLSTSDVYRAYDSLDDVGTAGVPLNQLVGKLSMGGCRSIGRWMRNGLQQAASALSPAVGKLRQAFAELDFAGHQLTGSGSAYFGVCRHAQHARRLANILRSRQLGLVYVTRSCQ